MIQKLLKAIWAVALMMIDNYIERIERVIDGSSTENGEKLLEEVFAVFKKDIPNIRDGTTYDVAIANMVLNLNDLKEPLPEDYCLLDDLKLVLNKLKLYKDLNTKSKSVVNNTVINISKSKINKSNLATKTSNQGENETKRMKIFGIIVGIVTIVGVVFTILFGLGILGK